MNKRLGLYFILVMMMTGTFLVVKAQEKKQAIPEEASRLQLFVGKWSGTFTYTNDKKESVKLTSYMNFNSIADGFGVFGVESADDPKLGKMRSSDLMGYDPYDKKLHCFTVDNTGICHDHSCTWKTPDHLYMEHKSMRSGTIYREMIDLVFKDKETIEFNETVTLDDAVSETTLGVYKKVK